MMDTKRTVLAGMIITALITAVVLVDFLPALVEGFFILLAGLGLTYYAALSQNRIKYIAEQRLLLEFNKELMLKNKISDIEMIIEKYAGRITAGEFISISKNSQEFKGLDGLDEAEKWIRDNHTPLIVDNNNPCPREGMLPENVSSLLGIPISGGHGDYGILYIVNKKDGMYFSKREMEMLGLVVEQAAAKISNLLDSAEQEQYDLDLLKALVRAVEGNDPALYGHSERVAAIAVLLSGKLGFDDLEKRDLYYSALLHDIGKLGQPTPADAELDDINSWHHASQGALFLKDTAGTERIREAILYHHERYDGSGSPEGLSFTDIPFMARIIAAADIYDAMTRLCPEDERLEHRDAVQVLKKASGSILDPLVVVALEEVEDQIARTLKENDD